MNLFHSWLYNLCKKNKENLPGTRDGYICTFVYNKSIWAHLKAFSKGFS